MVIFKSKRKNDTMIQFNDTVKINLIGKRIYPTASVKYLGIKSDQHLTWQHHINDQRGLMLYYLKLGSLLMIKY